MVMVRFRALIRTLILVLVLGVIAQGHARAHARPHTPSQQQLAQNHAAPRFNSSGPFTFDYLLGEDANFNSDRAVIFLDYEYVSASVIRALKAAGKRVICYVNVGGWEVYRSDASSFPSSVLGKEMDGWPDERWLDIRQLDILLPIMRVRFETAASKGCEGVDPDNMEGYVVDSGFPLTKAHQVAYNRAIMEAIHAAGGAGDVRMLAGQKNAAELTPQLVDVADFAVVEECQIGRAHV